MTEQWVPQLATNPAVRSDVWSAGSMEVPDTYYDIVVSHTVKRRKGFWGFEKPGHAASTAEADKKRKYQPGPCGTPVWMPPVAFETNSRMGTQSAAELSRLAREYALRVTCRFGWINVGSADGVFVQTLRQWRAQPSCGIQAGNAMMLARAIGIRVQAAFRKTGTQQVEAPGRMAGSLRSKTKGPQRHT